MNNRRFHELHAGPDLLVLVNCWDAASARVLASLGAPAIATTSAGLCWANGYADGGALPIDKLLHSVRAICGVVEVPVSVDLESGYSDDPAEVARLAGALIELGVAGINLEDGAAPVELLEAKIASIKREARRRQHELFVNARTDVYLRELVPEGRRSDEVVVREARYRRAGADGLFVPGLIVAEEIRAIASAIELPLNVMDRPGIPSREVLRAMGARRLSSGSALAQLALGYLRKAAVAFLDGQSLDAFARDSASYAELNALFTRSE